MNQAQFSDLDDEITADDWLVPREEISRRRLFKRTPKYNIYKADWFGDVLVYEPVPYHHRLSPTSASASVAKRPASSLTSSNKELADAEKSRTEELRLRLANLELDINRSAPFERTIPIKKPPGSLNDSEQNDSAYSSISSTPHYHSKDMRSEFEFPQSSASRTSFGPSFSETVTATTIEATQTISHKSSPRAPVILNKDSYIFNYDLDQNKFNNQENDDTVRDRTNQSNTSTNSTSSWQELNELRLIAHESFMLFMGASIVDECLGVSASSGTTHSGTSLVMQMSHPKAVSLHNLLHQNRQHQHHQHHHNQQVHSPIDRFFTTRQYFGFGIAAKLNICQQIRDAMTYLHGKNIVHGRLTSFNIYIEPNQRVKISLIDNDERPIANVFSGATTDSKPTAAAANDDSDNSNNNNNNNNSVVEFNAPALAYLSPELMRTLKVVPSRSATIQEHKNGDQRSFVQIDIDRLTKKSDIFSFGTIIYELFHEELPFKGVPATEVIYLIGSGQMEKWIASKFTTSSKAGECPAPVQEIISACWSHNAQDRPEFKFLKFDNSP